MDRQTDGQLALWFRVLYTPGVVGFDTHGMGRRVLDKGWASGWAGSQLGLFSFYGLVHHDGPFFLSLYFQSVEL